MSTTTPELAAEAMRQFVTEQRRRFETDPAWIAARADAQALGLKPGKVWEFKRRHRLPHDQRLSTDARQLLELEQETAQRVARGEQLERAQAIALIAQRATPETASAVAEMIPPAAHIDGMWIAGCDSHVDAYLLNRVKALTGKRYVAPAAACKWAATLAPAAAALQWTVDLQRSSRKSSQRAAADRRRLRWFWGVILRLDQLEGPPPNHSYSAFYAWCQLEAYYTHGGTARSLGDLLTGRIGSADARGLLNLPATGPLDPAAIRAAYRAEARHHHPDIGGDRHRFERLSEARDRLLLEVG